jgi:steroid delta-isomerase-like uncharacterized protein
MDPDKNKAIARRYFLEICNQGNFGGIEELLTPNIVFENPPAVVEGIESFKELITSLRTAFPDFHFTVEDEIAEGNKVVTRWRLRGTQRGYFLGNPPTHKPFNVTGIDIFQIAEGKIERVWVNMDLLGQAQQLDWIPSPQSTA